MSEVFFNEYLITNDKSKLSFDDVIVLLKQSYWANERSHEVVKKAIENSICYGVLDNKTKKQIGFARIITDYATCFYLCDVIVDKDYRGKGIGKALVDFILNNDDIKGLKGLLITKDAQGLYEKYGFSNNIENLMLKRPD